MPLTPFICSVPFRELGERLKILHSIRKLWQMEAEPSKVTNASKATEMGKTEQGRACMINSRVAFSFVGEE